MSTIVYVLLGIVGFFVYLFFYWKRLREDVPEDSLFTSGLIIFVFALAVSILTYRIFSGHNYFGNLFYGQGSWFWGGVAGYLLGFVFCVYKFKLRFFEVFETSAMGMYAFYSILMGVFGLLIFILFYFLEKRYKKYSWYSSGKVGFSGLVCLGVVFLLRACIANFFPTVVSFSGRVDIVLSAAVSFLMFFGVYHLS